MDALWNEVLARAIAASPWGAGFLFLAYRCVAALERHLVTRSESLLRACAALETVALAYGNRQQDRDNIRESGVRGERPPRPSRSPAAGR